MDILKSCMQDITIIIVLIPHVIIHSQAGVKVVYDGIPVFGSSQGSFFVNLLRKREGVWG